MQHRRTLSRVERCVAVALALVWLAGAGAGLYVAFAQSRWAVAVAALAAIGYGLVWLRVAALARLLRWSDLVAPWRAR